MTGRRVAIAYTSFAVGRGLLQYARDKVLSPNDEIYIVHAFTDKNPVRPRTPPVGTPAPSCDPGWCCKRRGRPWLVLSRPVWPGDCACWSAAGPQHPCAC